MRRALATAAAAMFVALLVTSPTALAETPSTNPIAKAAGAMNPMNWSMPQWKPPQWNLFTKSEPARIKKKDDGIFKTVSRKTSSGWAKTKRTLSPSNLFGPMYPPEQQTATTGTVNEFLAQPQPGR